VGHMQLDCTTQLIIRLRIGTGDFYTVSTTDDIYKEPENKFEELGTGAGKSFAPPRRKAPGDPSALDVYLRDWLMQVDDVKNWVVNYAGGNKTHLVIKVKTINAKGKVTDYEISQTACTSGDGYDKFEDTDPSKGIKKIIEAKLANLTVNKYEGGYCYYRVPIRHFDDSQTPWTLTKSMTNEASSLYGGNAANYLGRYGVVRNNWYEVEITEISCLGAPTLSDASDDGDDWDSEVVSLKISVLPWYGHEMPDPL